MAKNSNLASMSIEALFKLRDEVAGVLARRADDLKKQLAKLGIDGGKRGRKKGGGKRGKVAPQFRSKKNPELVWSGRGATPRWMREEMKGTKLKKENFRIKD